MMKSEPLKVEAVSFLPTTLRAPCARLLLLALLLLTVAAVPVSAQTPVGWWKFDEGAGTTAADASGSGNTGTLQAGATWTTGLVGSNAVSLAGTSTSFVDVATPVVDTTKSYTVMGWVNLSKTSGYQTLVSIDGSSVSGFFLQLRGDTGKFAFTALPSDAGGTAFTVGASVAPTTGQWYHLAGVYDATAKTLSLYVNGSLQQTVTYAAAWKATGHTEIGRGKYGGSSVDFTSGKLDDVRFYQSALSSSAITAIAAAPVAPPSPVAWWKFDEGAGTTAADASGSGNTGTLQAGATWTTGLVGSNAVSLAGTSTSFVDVPKAVVDTTQSYTVMGWVNVNQVSGYQTFASIDGSSVSGFFLQLSGSTGKFALTALPSDATTGTAVSAAGSTAPVAGEWYHVAGVYDATAKTLSLYVNGSLQQTVAYTAAWKATGHTEIGRGKYGGANVDFSNSLVDDVRFYQSALAGAAINAIAQADLPPPPPPTLKISAGAPVATVSPTFYGMMIEEINHSLDGGLYAELIQNRIFQDDATTPVHWSVIQDNGGTGAIALDTTQPINTALTTCLKLTATAVSGNQRVGVANDGYWGIPVVANTTYKASFYAKSDTGLTGPLTVDIESSDGATIYASAQVAQITTGWQKYSVTLTTGAVASTETTRFVVSTGQPGTVCLNLVSLFPPTFNNRPNGNRSDLMQMMANLTPSFLRLPGGNYLEGNTIADRFQWKNTIGPIDGRPGHTGTWSYRSSDGLGLLEFLEWCEDLNMQPVLAVWAGYALNGDHIVAGANLTPYVQDALDEIEYVTGDASTTWGARRIADGHPAAFPLTYVEIGNEDFFDSSGSYDGRFTQFYDAIKAQYPALQLIATTGVSSRTPDVYDDHYYRSPSAFEADVHHYDNYNRAGSKIFVGEWASQEGQPTPDLNSALGDAAWMTGMERNSDLVVLESYAPLLVNVNTGARQWGTNLIGYDALSSYGSPSYYVQAMFGANTGDGILSETLGGVSQVYSSATRDSKTGTLYVKVVNAAGASQLLHLTLTGAGALSSTGTALTLSSSSPSDTNTLATPTKVVPVSSVVSGVGATFDYAFAPYSVTVLTLPQVPTLVSTLTLNPASVVGGSGSTGTVTLSAPASSGGALVSLSSSDASTIVPASVLVPAGKTAATFPLTTSVVTQSTTDSIAAGYNNSSQTANLTVNPPAGTAITVASSLNPAPVGTNITFTATVTGSSPTGTVQFALDGSSVGSPVTLSNGSAAYSTAGLSVGTHSVTAAYSGNAANAASVSGTLSQTVNKTATATTVITSLSPSAAGQSVTFTATVTGNAPTGTVTFTEGNTTLGTGTLANGTATFSTASLAVSTHQITASYGGDAANASSQSSALAQAVKGVPTANPQTMSTLINHSVSLMLTGSDPNTPPLSLTYAVTTQPAHGVLTGTAPNLTYTPNAGYTGSDSLAFTVNNGFLTSSPATVSFTINPLPATTTALASSLNPSTFSQSVTFTATVTGSAPTGSVGFYDGNTLLGTGTLANGVATYSTAALSISSHSLSARYGGDAQNASSQSGLLTQTVLAPVITVAPASVSVTAGKTQQFTATANDQHGSPLSSQPAFTWKVSGGGTISTTGLFTATTVGGPFTVTATSGTASGTASVTVTAPASSNGLKGEYFANQTLTAPVALTRTDAVVNFSWGNGSPAPGLPVDHFSARWTGQVQAPVSGAYTFSTVSDDGVRLYVNGALVINNWTTHPATLNHSNSIALKAGQVYSLKMEYFENSSQATAQLLWNYPGQSQQVIPQARLQPAP